MKVYGLPLGQGLDLHRWNYMARAAGEGYIVPLVLILGQGQSINLIVTGAKVSIAFSALNNFSAITR